MKKIFLLAGIIVCALACRSQFPNTDSLHRYNNRYIRNSAVEAFSNLRLNTLLHGIIQWVDSAKAGAGGSLGIDTIYSINDSTLRYKKNGVTSNVTLRGTVDARRFVDSVYMLNDSVMRVRISGANRDIIIRGNATGAAVDLSTVQNYIDSSLTNNTAFKTYIDSVVAALPAVADQWGDQTVVGDSSFLGLGTDADSLRLNFNIVVSKAVFDSTIAALLLSGGADNWGTQKVEHDYTLIKNGTIASLLGADTTVLMTFRAFDSAKATLPGTDKFPTITGTSTSTPLSNASDKFPTELSVYNAIQAAVLSSGTTLTGWYNILNYGGVANGTFTTGTDNSVAINAAITAAPTNSVIFIPPGSYRCLTTITWPTAKRLFLVSYGTLYFGSNTGFIIDNTNQPIIWSYGTIYGTDQGGTTTNYGTQTNAGIYLRNSRNTEVHINTISGFKYAIKCGGYGNGNQYNRIWFNYLSRNSVGIAMTADGPTTSPRWSNDNSFYGGQIVADTGVIFIKDVNPGDFFNGNTFYNLGFEYAGGSSGGVGTPMRLAITGDHGRANSFYHFRIEPNGVTQKFLFTTDFAATQFYGVNVQDAWLDHMGAQAMITGVIYDDNGDILGNLAMGYPYISGSYYNERIRIYGTKRSPVAAGLVKSWVDMDWPTETFVSVTTSTYTVPLGIKTVFVNYSGGTATITLPAASTSGDRVITIKNNSTINNVVVSGPTTGQTVTIAPNMASDYISNRSLWYDKSQKPAGGGGSSQWTDVTGGVAYGNLTSLGFVGSASGVVEIAAGNTSRPAIVIGEGPLTTVPKNNAFENLSGRQYFTDNSIRKEFIFSPASGGLANQILVRNAANTGFNYADQPLRWESATPSITVGPGGVVGTSGAVVALGSGSKNLGGSITLTTGTGGAFTTGGMFTINFGTTNGTSANPKVVFFPANTAAGVLLSTTSSFATSSSNAGGLQLNGGALSPSTVYIFNYSATQ